ncbi:hypothetical protein M1N59_01175 [Dehalococcoidales bacterium]|nr:hypothetical protein [Dehalococcoidales bacterium]
MGAPPFFAKAEEHQELERPEPLFPKPCPEELKFFEQFGIKEAGPGEVVEGTGEYVPGEGFRLLINGDEVNKMGGAKAFGDRY